jgi:hypothetical protein
MDSDKINESVLAQGFLKSVQRSDKSVSFSRVFNAKISDKSVATQGCSRVFE